jgi:outer membrane protein
LLILQRSNAELVKQNRDLVEKEYAAGQTSLVRLNEAQRDLINAQSQMAVALVSLKQAWQDLKAATGEILIPFSVL